MILESIVKSLGVDKNNPSAQALLRSLKGITEENAYRASPAILHVMQNNPDAFDVNEIDKARKILQGLYHHPKEIKKQSVGTELSKLIPDWAVKNKSDCGCSDMAARMDMYGIRWCKDNKDTIVAHLMSQSEHLIPAFKLVPAAMKKIVAEQLVNKAIENARKAT